MPLLGERFRLAQKLSELVYHIHSCGWLHKGLRADNIIFFSAPHMSIENPYIVGWEYSRKEAKVEHTESMLSGTSEANLYAHPSQLRGEPYCRKFDHYQLGCLLIEIGYWKPLEAMRAKSRLPYPQANSPHAWAEFLMKQADDLKFFMGGIYHDVTKRLLEGLDSEYAEFGPHVVWELRKCNA
jgi:serine/threonine protein kinase